MPTVTMKMALASAEDMEVAYDLLGLLDNVERDYYPADENDDDAPTHLDTDDIDHLRFFYNKLKEIVDRRGTGAMHRVIGGFSTVRYAKNQILDLTQDVVALHPRIIAALDRAADHVPPFQQRVQPWMLECFGAAISADREERNHRFYEEATEAVQANGMTCSEAHQLVDYTYGRPIGELHQEIGGVMVTLAALCLASGQDMHAAGEAELARISAPETIAKIRAKQAAKPKHSPLPEALAAATQGES
jgi:hypothetical protein